MSDLSSWQHKLSRRHYAGRRTPRDRLDPPKGFQQWSDKHSSSCGWFQFLSMSTRQRLLRLYHYRFCREWNLLWCWSRKLRPVLWRPEDCGLWWQLSGTRGNPLWCESELPYSKSWMPDLRTGQHTVSRGNYTGRRTAGGRLGPPTSFRQCRNKQSSNRGWLQFLSVSTRQRML